MNDYQIAYMKKIIFQRILVDLDETKEKAYNLYSYVLNSSKSRDKDLLLFIEETINQNQKARMYCQKNIMEMICIMIVMLILMQMTLTLYVQSLEVKNETIYL